MIASIGRSISVWDGLLSRMGSFDSPRDTNCHMYPAIPKTRIEEYWNSLDKRQAKSNVLEIYKFMQDSEPELATTQSFNYGVLSGKEPVQPNPKSDLASLITQAGITWEDLQSLVQTRRNNYGPEGSSGDNQNF